MTATFATAISSWLCQLRALHDKNHKDARKDRLGEALIRPPMVTPEAAQEDVCQQIHTPSHITDPSCLLSHLLRGISKPQGSQRSHCSYKEELKGGMFVSFLSEAAWEPSRRRPFPLSSLSYTTVGCSHP